MSTTLKNYISSGKSGSHYTIYFNDYSLSNVIKFFSDKLDKINKTMKDSFKKKLANNIIYEIKTNIENGTYNDPFNYFILANEKECNIIPFSSNDIILAKEWNISSNIFEFAERFKINYLLKLFSTELNLLVYHFNNKDVTIKYVDNYKVKIDKKVSIDKFDDICKKNLNKFSIYCGLSSYLDKNKPIHIIKGKSVSNDDIIEYYNRYIEDKNIDRLNRDIIGNISNEKISHKFLFGKFEISNGITNMIIKTLFIEKKLYKTLRKKLADTNSLGLINFEVVTIKDINILKKYDGMLAEKYY
tara:strand:- start:3465 stop:4367 length:903 start_codon:yes stop_codon:yes gene_type:complete